MTLKLVQDTADPSSQKWLDEYYRKNLIPAEKKPFLIDLARCSGPYLAVEESDFILDAASQIASNGLGFNSGASFGTAQFLESWSGRTDTATIQSARRAYAELLQRLSKWPSMSVQFTHSGAEAIEIALYGCYSNRTNPGSRKVLAFEGAFHGRMMVALTATWSPPKREPFAWSGYESTFAPYPEMKSDNVGSPEDPNGWVDLWAQAPLANLEQGFSAELKVGDKLLQAEIESLLAVRKYLETNEYYAVLIEPMQCEGGDRYSSARFHRALAAIARSYSVPLVYDEIQTGFGLGGEFFWHQKFDLDPEYSPDYVILAKKAQVGAVLSRQPIELEEEFNPSSLIRGYINASMIDQYQGETLELEQSIRSSLDRLIEKHQPHLSNPRTSGLSFAFDFASSEQLDRFVACRFDHGMLYYPAGSKSARFRLNLAFRKPHLEQLWMQLDAALLQALSEESNGRPTDGDSQSAATPSQQEQFEYHKSLILSKLGTATSPSDVESQIERFILASMTVKNDNDVAVHFLTAKNYGQFRDRIWDIQVEVYEPLRQTPIEKFDKLIKASGQRSIVVTNNDRIVAMAFAAPLSNFPYERGLRLDSEFHSADAIYMLDLTVTNNFRGGLGKVMKQAMCLLAAQSGVRMLVGRNRDRLARTMWAINLSLGSYTERILHDDYLDDESHRDCFVYHCPLAWSKAPINLAAGVSAPLNLAAINEDFVDENMPSLINKLTLSNFVTKSFLSQLADVFEIMPPSLQHGYAASGPSECVDKIVKSIWLKRKPRQRLVAVGGGYFGNGSFISRSLSGIGEPYFPVTHVSLKGVGDEAAIEALVRTELSDDDVLAVFVEPMGWKTGRRIHPPELAAIAQGCRSAGVPLVFHDSASLFHRYDKSCFTASGFAGLSPDAAYSHLGGQMAVTFLSDEFFASNPLQMISTWDGDVFSMAQFHSALSQFKEEEADHFKVVERFDAGLRLLLKRFAISTENIFRGIGRFRGNLPFDLANMFYRNKHGDLVSMPSVGEMRRFLESDIVSNE